MSDLQAILTWSSMVLGAIVSAILVWMLVGTLMPLRRARRYANELADGLEAAVGTTASVPEQIPAINSGLTTLLTGLESVDGHLAGTAAAYGLR